MTVPQDDRAAILARRALLISSALAAMGCSPPNVPDASSQGPSWSEFAAGAPPLHVSSSLPAEDREELVALEASMGAARQSLADAWATTTSGCTLGSKELFDEELDDCSLAWRKVDIAVDNLAGSSDPACLENMRAGYVARYIEQARFLKGAAKRLAVAVEANKRANPTAWRNIRMSSRIWSLQPCLSCTRSESMVLRSGGNGLPLEPVSVSFAGASDSVDPQDVKLRVVEQNEEVLDELYGEGTTLQVCGHADPREPGDLRALSRARAQAVVDSLVAKGMKPERLAITAFGADLPVAQSADAAGQAKNRRVDFNIVRRVKRAATDGGG